MPPAVQGTNWEDGYGSKNGVSAIPGGM
jgi:hypothetical protein